MADAAVQEADRNNTPEGWFAVSVLQSWLGQDQAAENAMKKAKEAGLETRLLDQLTLKVSGTRS
jgi:hypothetical protein